MNTNLLFSVVAMSAVPMTSFADGTGLELAKTVLPTADNQKTWTNAKGGSVSADKNQEVVFAKDNTKLTFTTDVLQPGTYTFSFKATTETGGAGENVAAVTAKLSLADFDPSNPSKVDGLKVTLAKAGKVTIALSATTLEADAYLSNFGFHLDFNYDQVKEDVFLALNNLSAQFNQIKDVKMKAEYQARITPYSTAVAEIRTVGTEYEMYGKYTMFEAPATDKNGVTVLIKGMKVLQNEISGVLNADAFHANVVTAYEELKGIVDINFNDASGKENAYAKSTRKGTGYGAEVAALQEEFNTYFKGMDDFRTDPQAYAKKYADLGESNTDKDSKWKHFNDEKTRLTAAIKKAIDGDLAYQAVKAEFSKVANEDGTIVDGVDAVHSQKQELVNTKMIKNPGQSFDAYTYMRREATTELGRIYNKVCFSDLSAEGDDNYAFNSLLGTSKNHDKAGEGDNKTKAIAMLDQAIKDLDAKTLVYYNTEVGKEGLYNKEFAAYAVASKKLQEYKTKVAYDQNDPSKPFNVKAIDDVHKLLDFKGDDKQEAGSIQKLESAILANNGGQEGKTAAEKYTLSAYVSGDYVKACAAIDATFETYNKLIAANQANYSDYTKLKELSKNANTAIQNIADVTKPEDKDGAYIYTDFTAKTVKDGDAAYKYVISKHNEDANIKAVYNALLAHFDYKVEVSTGKFETKNYLTEEYDGNHDYLDKSFDINVTYIDKKTETKTVTITRGDKEALTSLSAFNEINGFVSTYETDARDAIKAFVDIDNSIFADVEALKELQALIDENPVYNKTVIAYNNHAGLSSETKKFTYQDVLDAYNSKINDSQIALKNASDYLAGTENNKKPTPIKNDAALGLNVHTKQVQGYKHDSQTENIKLDVAAFKKDLEKFTFESNWTLAGSYYKTADTEIKALEAKINTNRTAVASLGNAKDDLSTELTNFEKNRLAPQKEKLVANDAVNGPATGVLVDDNKALNLALIQLPEVIAAIGNAEQGLVKELNVIADKITAAKTAYDNNTNKKYELVKDDALDDKNDGTVVKLQNHLNPAKEGYINITDPNKISGKGTEEISFVKAANDNIDAYNTTLSQLVTDINASASNETLVADMEDKTNEQGEVTPGFTSRINTVSDNISALDAQVVIINENYNNYKAISDYHTGKKIAELISAMENNLKDGATVNKDTKAVGQNVQTYIKETILAGYQTESDNLRADNTNGTGYYNQYKKVGSDPKVKLAEDKVTEAMIESYKASIDNIVANIATVEANAYWNEVVKAELDTEISKTSKALSDLNVKIAVNDPTQNKEQFVKEIEAEFTKLGALRTQVDAKYGKSELSKDNKQQFIDINNSIVAKTADIERRYNKYAETAILNENIAHYNAVIAVYEGAEKSYVSGAALLDAYGRLTDAELKKVVTEAVFQAKDDHGATKDHSDALYKQYVEIQKQKSAFMSAYNAFADRETKLFDAKNEKGQEAQTSKDGIDKYIVDNISGAAKNAAQLQILNVLSEYAKNAVNNARNILNTTYGFVNYAKAYENIDTSAEYAPKSGVDFIVSLDTDTKLANLRNVDALIKQAEGTEAAKEWTAYKAQKADPNDEKSLDYVATAAAWKTEVDNWTLQTEAQTKKWKDNFNDAYVHNDPDNEFLGWTGSKWNKQQYPALLQVLDVADHSVLTFQDVQKHEADFKRAYDKSKDAYTTGHEFKLAREVSDKNYVILTKNGEGEGDGAFVNHTEHVVTLFDNLNNYLGHSIVSNSSTWREKYTMGFVKEFDGLTATLTSQYNNGAISDEKKEAHKATLNGIAGKLDAEGVVAGNVSNYYRFADQQESTELATSISKYGNEITVVAGQKNPDFTTEKINEFTAKVKQFNDTLTSINTHAKWYPTFVKAENGAYTYPKFEAYVKLEGQVARAYELLYTYANEVYTQKANDVNARYHNLATEYNKLNAVMTSGDTHKDVKKIFAKQYNEATKLYNAVNDYYQFLHVYDAETKREFTNLIFNYDNIMGVIKAAEVFEVDGVSNLTFAKILSAVNTAEKAYDDHATHAAEALSTVTAMETEFKNTIVEEIKTYDHFEEGMYDYKSIVSGQLLGVNLGVSATEVAPHALVEYGVKQIEKHFRDVKAALKPSNHSNDNSVLNPDDYVANTNLQQEINMLRREAAQTEYDFRLNAHLVMPSTALVATSNFSLDVNLGENLADADRAAYQTENDYLLAKFKESYKKHDQLLHVNDKEFFEAYKARLNELGSTKNVYNADNLVEVPSAQLNNMSLNERVSNLSANIAFNKITPGDLNSNGKVESTDYMGILQLSLNNQNVAELYPEAADNARFAERILKRADITEKDGINVGDVVLAGDIVKGFKTQRLNTLVNLLATANNQNVDRISLSVSGEGTSQRIAIALDNQVDYVAGQMDIVLPAGVTLVGESLSDRAANQNLHSNDLDNGVHRVIIASMDNNLILGNDGAVLYLDVEVSHNYNGEGIEVRDVMFVDEGARLHRLNNIAGGEATGVGTVTLTQEMKAKVYNLGGQLMNGLKKGVNIIKMQDGSVKKVFKK